MSKQKADKEKNKEQVSFKGSYTVEAALVMSITVFVLGSLIILTFYLHDRAVAQSLACEIASAGRMQRNEQRRTNEAKKAGRQVQASRFLGSRNLSSKISAGTSEASASLKASYPVPGFALQYFSGGNLSIQAAWDSEVLSPTKRIRLFRGLGNLAGKMLDIGDS